MNGLQIAGFIIITVGTFISFWGSYKQSQDDSAFQNNLSDYVDNQNKLNLPELKALKIIGTNPDNYKVIIKNFGNRNAENVKIIFDKSSIPNAFSANMITGFQEIPKGVELEAPMNLFSGIKMLIKLPNDDKKYKDALLSLWDQYNSGKKTFIPRFHIEFYFEGKKYESEKYYIMINKNEGLISFGKE